MTYQPHRAPKGETAILVLSILQADGPMTYAELRDKVGRKVHSAVIALRKSGSLRVFEGVNNYESSSVRPRVNVSYYEFVKWPPPPVETYRQKRRRVSAERVERLVEKLKELGYAVTPPQP